MHHRNKTIDPYQRVGGEVGRRSLRRSAGVTFVVRAGEEDRGDLIRPRRFKGDLEIFQNLLQLFVAEGDAVSFSPRDGPGKPLPASLVPSGKIAPGYKLFHRKSIPG